MGTKFLFYQVPYTASSLTLLNYQQLFHSYCIIMNATYKGVGRQEGVGWVVGEGWQLEAVIPSTRA